jgi:hypothetical protein
MKTKYVVLLGFAAVLAVVLAVPILKSKLDEYRVDLPDVSRPGHVVTLDQNWTDEQREQFHFTAQGTRLLPVKWFLALEQPCFSPFGCEKFSDPKYLSRFGFIPSPKSEKNPDGLPIGFAVDNDFVDPLDNRREPVVGLTCAACHTGELYFGQNAVRVEGAPAMIELAVFQKAMGLALAFNRKFPEILGRYRRFERSVLGPDATAKDKENLKLRIQALVDKAIHQVEVTNERHIYDNSAGFIRTDALSRIGNQVFADSMDNVENYTPANAAVRFPQIWDASWFAWVQYNSSIADPLIRNIGEALGVRAVAKLSGKDASEFGSSVNVRGLRTIEDLLAGPGPLQGLASPKWPSVFPPLDLQKASAGAALYKKHCQQCHLPPREELLADVQQFASARDRRPTYWWRSASGNWYLNLKDVDINYVGTDPRQAIDFKNRTVNTGDLGRGVVPVGVGLDLVTSGIAERFFRIENIPLAERRAWAGGRDPSDPRIRAGLHYKARPLNGIWAAGPYLHNGSVPTLDALLSSGEDARPTTFWMGSKQFDPVAVGYFGTWIKGATEFRTTEQGNSNSGHRFKDGPRGQGIIGPALSEIERAQIIEYLKSI